LGNLRVTGRVAVTVAVVPFFAVGLHRTVARVLGKAWLQIWGSRARRKGLESPLARCLCCWSGSESAVRVVGRVAVAVAAVLFLANGLHGRVAKVLEKATVLVSDDGLAWIRRTACSPELAHANATHPSILINRNTCI